MFVRPLFCLFKFRVQSEDLHIILEQLKVMPVSQTAVLSFQVQGAIRRPALNT